MARSCPGNLDFSRQELLCLCECLISSWVVFFDSLPQLCMFAHCLLLPCFLPTCSLFYSNSKSRFSISPWWRCTLISPVWTFRVYVREQTHTHHRVIWEEPKINNLRRLSWDLFSFTMTLWQQEKWHKDSTYWFTKACLVNLDTDPCVQSRQIHVYLGGKKL